MNTDTLEERQAYMLPHDLIGKHVRAGTQHEHLKGIFMQAADRSIAGGGNYLVLEVPSSHRARESRRTVAIAMRSLEVFYDRQRRHSALGYVSPEQFELQYASRAA